MRTRGIYNVKNKDSSSHAQPENNQEAIEAGVHDQTNTEDNPKEEKKKKKINLLGITAVILGNTL